MNVTRRLLAALALVTGCVTDLELPPAGKTPLTDPVYSCSCLRDGVRFAVRLCYAGEAEQLADAIVANEERVTEATCSSSPVGSCRFSCEPDAATCTAENGCYCK